MADLITVTPQYEIVERAIDQALRKLGKTGGLARGQRMAKARGYASLEDLMRAETTQKLGLEAAQGLKNVMPGAYASGGPLASAAATPAGSLTAQAPMLPAAGQTQATRMAAAQKLAQAMQGSAAPIAAPGIPLPAQAPSTVASLADDAVIAGLRNVQPGAYSAGGPLALLNKTPGWSNGVAALAPSPAALPAAPFGPAVPSAASAATQALSTAAAGTAGAAPIAASAAPTLLPGSTAPASAALTGRIAAPAATGFAASKLGSALLPTRGAGLLGGLGKARFAGQAGAGLMLGGTAGSLVDKANVGGKGSIWDQFTTGAVGGGVAGGIAGAGTGPGAAVTAGVGAVVGGLGNVLGNQLGWWGAKKNPSADTNMVDLAVSQVMHAADTAGLDGQQYAAALRGQAPLFEGKGGKAKLEAAVGQLLQTLPAQAASMQSEKQRLAYDAEYRKQAIADMQPRLELMRRQYNNLADLYDRNGDPEFAQNLRVYAEQYSVALIDQINKIPQQYALDRARSFAAQLDQARQSAQIGAIVGKEYGSNVGGLTDIAETGTL